MQGVSISRKHKVNPTCSPLSPLGEFPPLYAGGLVYNAMVSNTRCSGVMCKMRAGQFRPVKAYMGLMELLQWLKTVGGRARSWF